VPGGEGVIVQATESGETKAKRLLHPCGAAYFECGKRATSSANVDEREWDVKNAMNVGLDDETYVKTIAEE
jgi:hypothetical protein